VFQLHHHHLYMTSSEEKQDTTTSPSPSTTTTTVSDEKSTIVPAPVYYHDYVPTEIYGTFTEDHFCDLIRLPPDILVRTSSCPHHPPFSLY
jgi:hypothetical protein